MHWSVTVENTGQNSAQVSLAMDEDSSCDSDELSATVDPLVTLQSEGDTEDVVVTVSIGVLLQVQVHIVLFCAQRLLMNRTHQVEHRTTSLLYLFLRERNVLQVSTHLLLRLFLKQASDIYCSNQGNTDWSVSTDTSELELGFQPRYIFCSIASRPTAYFHLRHSPR